MCFDDWSSVSVRQEMYKHVAHGSTGTSQWRCHNCNCGTRRGEAHAHRTRTGTTPTEGPRSTFWQSLASLPLVTERMQFCEWTRHRHSEDELFFAQHSVDRHIRVLRVNVCSASITVTSEHWVIMLSANVSIRFRVSGWAGIVWDIVMDPYMLSDRLTGQWYREFLETILPGLLEDVPLAMM
jgi:hypothetical protein